MKINKSIIVLNLVYFSGLILDFLLVNKLFLLNVQNIKTTSLYPLYLISIILTCFFLIIYGFNIKKIFEEKSLKEARLMIYYFSLMSIIISSIYLFYIFYLIKL